MESNAPVILLDSCVEGQFSSSWRFSGHLRTVLAMRLDEVLPVIAEAESATESGMYAVGFVGYEAAHAFNSHLPILQKDETLPLAWFAIFRERKEVRGSKGLPASPLEKLNLSPLLTKAEYTDAVSHIHSAIADGKTYQINYTFPLYGRFYGDPQTLYQTLMEAQLPAFGAFMDTGTHFIISCSPELFFSVKDRLITTRPMKGTAKRGRFPDEDRVAASMLSSSQKEQAENLMIVDLLRNDLGKIAETGTVKAEKLFELEQYPTVYQLTSTITARLKQQIGIVDILKAMFPCGSVTGAPKVHSMEIIRQIEQKPRGIYCGAAGYLAPGGEACFSVLIRSLLLEKKDRTISIGVGSGITWDSIAENEFAECLNKADFIKQSQDTRLLESLLIDNGRYPRIERHLERLSWSASRVGYLFDRCRIRDSLLKMAEDKDGEQKVRLLLSHDGSFEIESIPLEKPKERLRLAIARTALDTKDLQFYIKTENRKIYETARLESPEADEVLLFNLNGELTEGTFNNLLLKIDGTFYTPPLSCGLLPGIMRQEMLEQGIIKEKVLYLSDLTEAEEIWLINSVRGMQKGNLLQNRSGSPTIT